MTLASKRKDVKWGREAIQGKGNPNFRGGKYIDDKGYVRLLMPEHPANICGYVYEHRLVLEIKLGRYLQSWETVHHINEVKTDNREENLFLTTVQEHIALHRTGTHHTFDKKAQIRKSIREKRKQTGFRKRDNRGRYLPPSPK